MSLINKVLRDLESQRDSTSERRARSPIVDQGLRSVSKIKSPLSRQQWVRLAAVLAIVAAAVFIWSQWGGKLLEVVKVATTPRVTTPAPVTPPKTAAQPAPPPAEPKPATPPVAVKPTAEPPAKDFVPAAPAVTPVAKPEPAAPPPTEVAKAAAPPAKPAQDIVVRKPRLDPPKPEKPVTAATPAPPTKTETAIAPAPALTPAPSPPAEKAEALPEKPKDTPKSTPEKPAGKVVLEKKVKPLPPSDKAENEYRLAANSLQQKRTGEAEIHLRAALAAQSTHIKARELLAGLLLQGGRWREAQSLLEQGVEQTPTHYPFVQLLARSYVDHGQEKKALELLEKSRDLANLDAEYFGFAATLYQRAGRHADAVTSFNEAVKLRPQEGRWWLGLAISLEATEQRKSAGDAYQRAVASGTLDRQLLQYAQQRLTIVRGR